MLGPAQSLETNEKGRCQILNVENCTIVRGTDRNGDRNAGANIDVKISQYARNE